ncbi:MAG: NAD(P)-dependent oxidoreductase [Anaerolineaceae bacterium]|nr:NAD(P)-dependent oxidoreductase [Anaerolineaceae bacterium]
MTKKVLLTGASGEVGFEVFKELLRRRNRYSLRILSLDQKRERKLFGQFTEQIEIIWGDLRNPDDVDTAVDGVDVILHTGALIPPAADHHPELAWEVNVGGTFNVLTAMKKQNNPPILIYTSSISVYGDRISEPDIKVGDALIPSTGDEYARTKVEAEKLIRNSGMQWTIFRLCGILHNRMKIQPLMFHMPLETALEFCHNSDAGYALVQAIECDALVGRIFNLGGGNECKIMARDFIHKMLPLFGLPPDTIPEHAFATRNFHSGYYSDGDELDALLGFRRKGLQDYFNKIRNNISPLKRYLVGMIPETIVRNWLIRMSEPLKAVRENNLDLISRFYGSLEEYMRLSSRKLETGV